MLKNKKAQITVFIIIGIILLFSSALVLYIRGQIVEQGIKAELEPDIRVPLEIEAINEFIESCVRDVSIRGVEALGQQGGYIDTSGLQTSGGYNPTEADALTFYPGHELKIPYWYYLSSRNDCSGDCVFDSKKPFLTRVEGEPSIEQELDKYVNVNLEDCLIGLSKFKEMGFEINPVSDIQTKTTITENDVRVLVEYSLEIVKEGKINTLSKFYVKLPVNLKRIYDLATEITKLEMNGTFLEKHTMNLIAGFSGLDEKKKLPPLEATASECSNKLWIKESLKEDMIKPMLSSYMRLLQLGGTLNYQMWYFNNPLKQGLHEGMVLFVDKPLGQEDLNINFDYLGWWPIYLEITPNEGQRLIPSFSLNWIFMGLCIERYRFAYDISYPVIVQIEDPGAFYQEGYLFQFALENNIRNNEPINVEFQQLTGGELDTLLRSDFGSVEQKQSGNIRIKVIDAKTKESLEGVQAIFCIPDAKGRCGVDTANIGFTDSEGMLVERFPIGMGRLSFTKDKYHDHFQSYIVTIGLEDEIEVKLQSIRTKNVTIKKIMLKKDTGDCSDECGVDVCKWKLVKTDTRDLEATDQIIISLERIGNEDEKEFKSFGVIEEGYNFTELELIPGEYKVDITVISNEVVIIPKSDRKTCCSWWDCLWIANEDEDFTLDEIELSSFFAGGAILSDSSRYWELKEEDLDSHKKIIFYAAVLDTKDMTIVEDLEQMGKKEDYSIKYRNDLEPDFE